MSDRATCRFLIPAEPFLDWQKCGISPTSSLVVVAYEMTANGNAFHAFTFDSAAFLASLDALEYYRQPLQSDADMQLFDIIATFRTANKLQRNEFVKGLAESQRGILALYAHRAATTAVRLKSDAWLESAILASVIANDDRPASRNIDLQLAIVHYCARTLNLSPTVLFDWAATYATDPLAAHLEAFGRRDDISLKKFGWVERKTADGIRFSARWE